jgi:hypothetical protein
MSKSWNRTDQRENLNIVLKNNTENDEQLLSLSTNFDQEKMCLQQSFKKKFYMDARKNLFTILVLE